MNAVRAARPLIHAITNFVTMEWVARGLLAAGARPVMARDQSEAALVAGAADGLLLNLGTWSPEVQAAMLVAGRAAAARSIPVVLDPVGAGGNPLRTAAALELLAAVPVAAIRGNAGEILGLAGAAGHTRGVDAVGSAGGMRLERAARALARRYRCVVAVTGEIDLVTDGEQSLAVRAGVPLMAQVPGAGCLVSGLIAAALAAAGPGAAAGSGAGPGPSDESAPGFGPGQAPGALARVAEALLWAGRAGELAATHAAGPGSFATAYLDALATASSLPAGRITPPLSQRLGLYVIVSGSTPLPVLEAILGAGCAMIQFREKRLPLGEQVVVATAMREACHRHGALFLVNDRVDLAQAVGADGVHLGQDDLPVAAARSILGPGAVIGATCETEAETQVAEEAGADYIGTGPVYATPSKADAGEPYGPAIATRISQATHLPVVGIGGIGPGGAAQVIAAGGAGVSVISAIVGAPDPAAATRSMLAEVVAKKQLLEASL